MKRSRPPGPPPRRGGGPRAVEFSPRRGPRDGGPVPAPRGVKNAGNTCYMGAALQTLFTLTPLRRYLRDFDLPALDETTLSLRTADASAQRLAKARYAFLRQLQATFRRLADADAPVTPVSSAAAAAAATAAAQAVSVRTMLTTFLKISPTFTTYRQEDAHEAVRQILFTMHRALQKVGLRDGSAADVYQQSIVSDLFCGSLASTVTCARCGLCSTSQAPFMDLSVGIPTAEEVKEEKQNEQNTEEKTGDAGLASGVGLGAETMAGGDGKRDGGGGGRSSPAPWPALTKQDTPPVVEDATAPSKAATAADANPAADGESASARHLGLPNIVRYVVGTLASLAHSVTTTAAGAVCGSRRGGARPWFGGDIDYCYEEEDTSAPVDLQTCLREFFAAETLTGNERYYCERCGGLEDATKRLALAGSAPEILCVHLKRFRGGGLGTNGMCKLTRVVHFPLEGLDLTAFASPSSSSSSSSTTTTNTNTNTSNSRPAVVAPGGGAMTHNPWRYNLAGIIRHRGRSARSGHYVAYVRKAGAWFLCDDSRVTAVAAADVRAQQAYVLLYRRTRAPHGGPLLLQAMPSARRSHHQSGGVRRAGESDEAGGAEAPAAGPARKRLKSARAAVTTTTTNHQQHAPPPPLPSMPTAAVAAVPVPTGWDDPEAPALRRCLTEPNPCPEDAASFCFVSSYWVKKRLLLGPGSAGRPTCASLKCRHGHLLRRERTMMRAAEAAGSLTGRAVVPLPVGVWNRLVMQYVARMSPTSLSLSTWSSSSSSSSSSSAPALSAADQVKLQLVHEPLRLKDIVGDCPLCVHEGQALARQRDAEVAFFANIKRDRPFVRKGKKKKTKTKTRTDKRHSWFIVDNVWLRRWQEWHADKRFVPLADQGGKAAWGVDVDVTGVPPPGPVTPTVLLREDWVGGGVTGQAGTGGVGGNTAPRAADVRPGLKPAVHYRAVSLQVWEFFMEHHGGGPEIRRPDCDIYSVS